MTAVPTWIVRRDRDAIRAVAPRAVAVAAADRDAIRDVISTNNIITTRTAINPVGAAAVEEEGAAVEEEIRSNSNNGRRRRKARSWVLTELRSSTTDILKSPRRALVFCARQRAITRRSRSMSF